VKNITVSVPDDVYRAARIVAAERGTSVSAMVKESLESMSRKDEEFLRLERLQNSALARIALRGGLKMSENLTREELHDRELARRLNQRAPLH
jgi:plasmid stability protein